MFLFLYEPSFILSPICSSRGSGIFEYCGYIGARFIGQESLVLILCISFFLHLYLSVDLNFLMLPAFVRSQIVVGFVFNFVLGLRLSCAQPIFSFRIFAISMEVTDLIHSC